MFDVNCRPINLRMTTSFRAQLLDLAAAIQTKQHSKLELNQECLAVVRDKVLPAIKLAIANDDWYRFETGAVVRVPISPQLDSCTVDNARCYAEALKEVLTPLQRELPNIIPNSSLELECDRFVKDPDDYNIVFTFTFPVPNSKKAQSSIVFALCSSDRN